MRLILKIVLLIIVLFAALFPATAMVGILFAESNLRFEWSMLIPFGLSILGILSFIFHIKTISIYKLLDKKVLLPKPNKVFWGLNLAYAASLLLLALLFVYMIIQTSGLQPRETQLVYFSILVGIPTFLGSILFFEAYFINEKLKENKSRALFMEIENIKGDSED